MPEHIKEGKVDLAKWGIHTYKARVHTCDEAAENDDVLLFLDPPATSENFEDVEWFCLEHARDQITDEEIDRLKGKTN